MSTLDGNAQDHVVEQALSDKELHRSLLDHLEAGIYMVDIRRRILYWNRGAEQISGYLGHDVVGHLCHGNLLMHCDGAGQAQCGKDCPLSTVMLDGRPREYTIYLRHRNGHRLLVQVRSRPIYDPSGEVVGAVEVFEQVTLPSSTEWQLLHAHGCLDQLTAVANRAFGEFRMAQALEALRIFGIPFGWLTVELDNAGELEHRYGQGMIESAMKVMARTMAGNLGPLDALARWGPIEFRVVTHSSWEHGLAELTDKLRVLARASDLDWWGDPVRVTVSIAGVMAEPEDSAKSLETRVAGALAKSRAGESAGPSKDLSKPGEGQCLR